MLRASRSGGVTEMVRLQHHDKARIRASRKRASNETAWKHNRRVLEDVLSCIGVDPTEKYDKGTPYMHVLESLVHWCDIEPTVLVGTEGSADRLLFQMRNRAEFGKVTIGSAAAADRFADHWRAMQFDHLLFVYPELTADARGYRVIERDTIRVPEFLNRGLDHGLIQRAFYLAPGRAAEACEMMLEGTPEEYIRAVMDGSS